MRTLPRRRRGRLLLAGVAVAALAALPIVLNLPSAAASVTPAAGGTYALTVQKSGMCLDVTAGSKSDGAALQQWGCSNANWQRFKLVAAGAGYNLVNVNSRKCVDVPGASKTSGTALQQWTCGDAKPNQVWKLVHTRSAYELVNVGSGLCVSDKGASTASGGPIIQETCTANSNKLWKFSTATSTDASTAPAAAAGSSPTPSASTKTSTSPTTGAASPSAAASVSGTSTSTAPVRGVTSADLYVSPSGSDSAAGTLAAPYATLAKAVSVVKAGQTIALRGGTYHPTTGVSTKTSGTASARIVLSNYQDEKVTIDAADVPSSTWTISISANYWTVKGLEIENSDTHPFVCTSCQYGIFQYLNIHDNLDSGFTLRGDNTIGNQVLDNDFSLNHDDATLGQNADGIAIKFGSGAGNVVKGNRMYDNSDDGIDLWMFTSPVTIQSNWSYGNGINRWGIDGFTGNGNGFKLGGGKPAPSVAHVVTNNAAWDNAGNGFTENSNGGSIRLTTNTAFSNDKAGFFFKISTSSLSKNLSLSNGTEASIGSSATASDNSWNGTGWSTSALASTSPSVAEGVRKSDGTLPSTTFLVNTKDSTIGASMTRT